MPRAKPAGEDEAQWKNEERRMSRVARMRQKFKDTDDGSRFEKNRGYEFWKLPDSGKVSVRFLPDGDEANDAFFWVENRFMDLPFAGVMGGNESKEVKVRVPCIKTWDTQRSCPILERSGHGGRTTAGTTNPMNSPVVTMHSVRYLFQGNREGTIRFSRTARSRPRTRSASSSSTRASSRSSAQASRRRARGLGDDCDPVSYGEDGLDFIIRREKDGEVGGLFKLDPGPARTAP